MAMVVYGAHPAGVSGPNPEKAKAVALLSVPMIVIPEDSLRQVPQRWLVAFNDPIFIGLGYPTAHCALLCIGRLRAAKERFIEPGTAMVSKGTFSILFAAL